jgi:O-methyltransferase
MTKKIEENFAQELFTFYKSIQNSLRNVKQTKKQNDLSYQCIVPNSSYSPWYDDSEFMETYNKVKPNTLVDIYRCFELWNYVKRNSKLEGAIVEIGVWRGGTGAILAQADRNNPNSYIILADTFEGVVKASSVDTIYKGGEHSDTSETIVNDLMKGLKLSNYKILKGIFPDKANLDDDRDLKIKLCHIDVDTYQSAKDIFNYVWEKMVKGGAVIFDDYGFWGCEGVTNLGNEIHRSDAVFIHNLNGHAIFVKI